MTLNKFSQIKLFNKLPADKQQWLLGLADNHHFSFQQLKMLTEYCADLVCWGEMSLEEFYKPETIGELKGKQASGKIFQQLKTAYESIKNGEKSYSENKAYKFAENKFPEYKMVEVDLKGKIMGKCPVASEKTRCCNLDTLDAVQQCGFECSYCSIQSFYHGNQVRFIKDLLHHLKSIELDPGKIYHIGTGQSSDSLMWGNKFGLLDSLCEFAKDNPNVILEMKSKSSRIEYFLKNPIPDNIIFTWSLNTPVVISHEEKGTASLEKRIESARKLSEKGIPIGFHCHPIVWYDGYKEDYRYLVNRLIDNFSHDEIVMFSLGTLTFIKPVLKRIRERMLKSSVLQMPMEDSSGKLSYPLEIKKELFTNIYNAFPETWKNSVFFYMCMENIELWEPVFGRSYPTNELFEEDMLASYKKKISFIKNKNMR